MNVKIQGGDGTYSNTGSCMNVASYLEHEDYHRLEQGLDAEPFFTQDKDNIQKHAFVLEMDNNKAKLCKNDAKFYVLTVSPSKEEIERMGNTEEERSRAFKRFIREKVIPKYASGFEKGLTADNIMYFAKIHHARNDKIDHQMHCHIVISRKTKDNRLKISPKTNHKKAKTSGTVKSGFDRTAFYQGVEDSFDKMFAYNRPLEEKFEYLNVMKNGSIEDLEKLVSKSPENYSLKFKSSNTDISILEQIQEKAPIEEEITPSFQPINRKQDDFDEFTDLKKKKRKKRRGLSL